ncbi:MAG: site-specific integrase [Candidatus Hydrogenedentes bacterium]|nr:site-specific integrase [Candidatus Hydrogenedentota bacterium]
MRRKETSTLPPLRFHKARKLGYVVLNDRYVYLGKFDDPELRNRYDQTIAEWLARGRQPVAKQDAIIAEVVAAYWQHAVEYYVRPDGTPSGGLDRVRNALKVLRDLYGGTPAAEFGPLKLRALREKWLSSDRKRARRTVNGYIAEVKHMFKWAVSHELVPPSVFHGLTTVVGLRAGRSAARETEPVRPVPEADVTAVLPHVSRQVGAMIGLQLLTAARSGEIVRLRPIDFDTSGAVWLARLSEHKNAYRGHERILYFGPRAQQIVKEFLVDTPVDAYLFRPTEAEEERLTKRHAKRKTPDTCGNVRGSNRVEIPKTKPGACYTSDSYRRAIERACVKAKVPVWTPHRLRHNAATIVRREYGLEAAQLILGHARADVTQLYAEVNHLKALEVAHKIG